MRTSITTHTETQTTRFYSYMSGQGSRFGIVKFRLTCKLILKQFRSIVSQMYLYCIAILFFALNATLHGEDASDAEKLEILLRRPRLFELVRRVEVDAESPDVKSSFPFDEPASRLFAQIDQLLIAKQHRIDGTIACRIVFLNNSNVARIDFWSQVPGEEKLMRKTWKRRQLPVNSNKPFGNWEDKQESMNNGKICDILKLLCEDPMPPIAVMNAVARLTPIKLDIVVEIVEMREQQLHYRWAIRSNRFTEWNEEEMNKMREMVFDVEPCANQ